MHSLALILSLFCHSPNGFEMFAEVKVTSVTDYDVKLRNTWSEMPVHQKSILFNEQGEPIRISTSALWESFTISKTESEWVGEYWYDNAHYDLSCKELP